MAFEHFVFVVLRRYGADNGTATQRSWLLAMILPASVQQVGRMKPHPSANPQHISRKKERPHLGVSAHKAATQPAALPANQAKALTPRTVISPHEFDVEVFAGGVDFPFENYERMADFMRRCKGKVMVSINNSPTSSTTTPTPSGCMPR